jgi:citrate synthase
MYQSVVLIVVVDSMQRSFLYQMDCLGQQDYHPNPVLENALDVLFLLHADHELNASTTTVLQAASSLTDPYSAIS